MLKSEFKEAVQKIADELRLASRDVHENHLVIAREHSRLTCSVQLTETGAFIYLYFRTTSWDWDGERTDLNDLLSVLPAAFFRLVRPFISCVLYDIEHPVGGMPECEVYARYIVFGQPESNLSLSQDSVDRVKEILGAFILYEYSVGSFLQFDRSVPTRYSFEDDALKAWVERVQAALDRTSSDNEWTYNLRTNPHWMFFRSLDAGASVYHSPATSSALRGIMDGVAPWTELAGPTVRFFKSEFAHNAATNGDIERCSRILERLEGPSDRLAFIPLENRLIGVGNEHLVILEIDCDRAVYNSGREALLQRQRIEHEILFDGRAYTWADKVDGGRFEIFTRDLLSRRPGMVHVRQTSLTNEGDSNADLLCVWNVPSLADVKQPDKSIPLERRTIVVQCKAWARAVGKRDIPDIRDTLDRHDASGILVVALSVRRSLAEHLAILRKRDVWTDFWGRAEIEEQLDANPDLVRKYPDIVEYAAPTER
jgi:Restriction endonuclease